MFNHITVSSFLKFRILSTLKENLTFTRVSVSRNLWLHCFSATKLLHSGNVPVIEKTDLINHRMCDLSLIYFNKQSVQQAEWFLCKWSTLKYFILPGIPTEAELFIDWEYSSKQENNSLQQLPSFTPAEYSHLLKTAESLPPIFHSKSAFTYP